MGADLYIESVNEKCLAKWKPKFDAAVAARDAATTDEARKELQKEVSRCYDEMYADGYFRDSYNSTNLLWQLGLSWWEDVGNMLDEEGNLPVETIKEFVETVKDREVPPPHELRLEQACVDDGENSLESWHRYFVEKRERFIKFLETAIRLDEPIIASI